MRTSRTSTTMQLFNASAVVNASRLAYSPSICLPHLKVKTFDEIPIPLVIPGQSATIKGLVIDKDNCFAKDKDDKVWPPYNDAWKKLCNTYKKEHLLIVSNSAGTNDDENHAQAAILEANTGITVLRHSTKKPGCHEEILEYFRRQGISSPSEIAVIGDRLFTDMLMANMMGSWGVWISQGVELSESIWVKAERKLYSTMRGNQD